MGREEDYPSQSSFAKGRHWMKGILDTLIRKGDRQVCESLYDQKPDWAPGPDTPGPAELRWNLGGYPLQAKPHQVRRDVRGVVARQSQQARAGQEEQLRIAQQGGQVQDRQCTVIPTQARPPTPSVLPTPPPLFSEEDEEDDENNDDGDDNDEAEETFHDAEEGGEVDEDAEVGDANNVIMTNVDQTDSIAAEVEETEESEESGDSEEESEEG